MEFDKEEIIIKRENNFFIASIETLGISSKAPREIHPYQI